MGERTLAERAGFLRRAGLPPSERPAMTIARGAIAEPVDLPDDERAPLCLALICTRNYLACARLVALTFRQQHPAIPVFCLVTDGDGDEGALFGQGTVVPLSALDIPHVGWYAARFSATELANSLKPVFLRYLAPHADAAVYLDCDIAVFAPLTAMIDAVRQHPLVLVPHMFSPLPRPEDFGTHPTRADIFNSGLINAGCFAIQLGTCEAFLRAWEDANFAPGTFHGMAGFQTDQQHLNWALVTVPGAYVLRDTSYNVAYWNLHERDLRVERPDGDLIAEVDGRPLTIFHFSGYDVQDRLRLSRHDERYSVYNLPAVADILSWYSDHVLGSPLAWTLDEPYAFDVTANGLRLTPFIRDLLKRYDVHIPKFDIRTQSGAEMLCAFLMDPLPATGSFLPLVAAAIYDVRPDLQALAPGAHTTLSSGRYWQWFCRHAGAEFGIQLLIDCFRRSLISDSLIGFSDEIASALQDPPLAFLGADRLAAAARLRRIGRADLADALLETRVEWCFSVDALAVFDIYSRREDLRDAFPDILGRDNDAFSDWLINHAAGEHGLPQAASAQFQTRIATVCLARIYSYLARHAGVAAIARDTLLTEDPGPLLRELIRGVGCGPEYDLDDVAVLSMIHAMYRHLLIPLYLELPCNRLEQHASRVIEENVAGLPETVRDTDWARLGCEIHAQYFSSFDAHLDNEMRRWALAASAPVTHVFGVLRGKMSGKRLSAIRRRASQSAMSRARLGHEATRARLSQIGNAEREPGVNVYGYFESDIGIGESSRGLAAAISRVRPVSRVPVNTSQVRDGVVLSDLFQRPDHFADTNLFVSYPHQQNDLLGSIGAEHVMGKQNIVHLAWEQTDANPLWKAIYDRYDAIWMISEFAATGFRRMFPDRVHVVPNVVNYEEFPRYENGGEGRLANEQVKFLFIFDANSSMERKNPEAVIEAFSKAFKGTRHANRVELTIKIGSMHRAEHAFRVERLLDQAHRARLPIHFDGRQLARDQLLQLVAACDCYVSLHRAEGFGYTIAEAMFYGAPVIASGYSGNLEYMTPSNSLLVPCEEVFVKDPDGPFQRGSVWGDPDIDAAVDMMRWVVEQPSEARSIGERGRQSVMQQLSADAVAEKVRTCFAAMA